MRILKRQQKAVFAGWILSSFAVFFASPKSLARVNSKSAKLLVIASTEGEPYRTSLTHFYRRLKERGWDKDSNLEVREFFIGNHQDTVANIWKHIIKPEGIEVVYISGTTASIGARKYLWDKNVKVVFSDVTDPVGRGLITDFTSSPKHNFTGVCFSAPVDRKLRFLKSLFPHVSKIGYIYADMASSTAYMEWLQIELKKPEFKGLQVIAEKIPFVPGEGGSIRMSKIAEALILKLDSQVDVFLSPSDSLGGQEVYVRTIARLATKPLIGLQEREVVNGWGAAASMYIPLNEAGSKAADMVVELFAGRSVASLPPQCPAEKVALEMTKLERHKPRWSFSPPVGFEPR